MNIDSVTNIIEIPLKGLDWLANHLILTLTLGGVGFIGYFVYKNRITLFKFINKIIGKIKKDNIEIVNVPYYSKLIGGGRHETK